MSKGKWKKKNPLLDYTYQNLNKSNRNINQKYLNNWLAHLFKQTNKIPYILFLNDMTLSILTKQAKKLNIEIETLIINAIINQNKELWQNFFNKPLKNNKDIENFKNQLNQLSKITKIGTKQEQYKAMQEYLKNINNN